MTVRSFLNRLSSRSTDLLCLEPLLSFSVVSRWIFATCHKTLQSVGLYVRVGFTLCCGKRHVLWLKVPEHTSKWTPPHTTTSLLLFVRSKIVISAAVSWLTSELLTSLYI